MLLLERLILRLGDLVEDAIEHLDALLDLLQRPIDLRLELPTVRHRARCLTTSRRRARSSGVESVDPTRLVRGGNNERERRAAFSVNVVSFESKECLILITQRGERLRAVSQLW